MKKLKAALALLLLMAGTQAQAQYYDDGITMEDALFYEEEEEPDLHKVYLNQVYVQFSPSRYNFDNDTQKLKFNEFAAGYARAIQILEKKQYFAEVGAQLKYSTSSSNAYYNNADFKLLTFKLPINLAYNLYVSKTKNIGFTPYAGVNFRAGILANEKLNGATTNLYESDERAASDPQWKRCQLGWQVGLRFVLSRFYVGAQYGRDFPDNSKKPQIYDCSAILGVCF